MRRIALWSLVAVSTLGSVSCGAANSLYQTADRLVQSATRTVSG